MTSTRSDGFNTLLYFFVPIQIMAVYGTLTERMEFILLFIYNIFVILAHLHYAICVVNLFVKKKFFLIEINFLGSTNL